MDERVTLNDIDWRFNPKLPRQACFELHTLKFIVDGYKTLLICKPGTGKSHVAKAVAYQATLQGYGVRYLEADGTFAQYALGNAAEQQRQLRLLPDAELLVLDDLFLARRISDSAHIDPWHGHAVSRTKAGSVLAWLLCVTSFLCDTMPFRHRDR